MVTIFPLAINFQGITPKPLQANASLGKIFTPRKSQGIHSGNGFVINTPKRYQGIDWVMFASRIVQSLFQLELSCSKLERASKHKQSCGVVLVTGGNQNNCLRFVFLGPLWGRKRKHTNAIPKTFRDSPRTIPRITLSISCLLIFRL